MSAVFCSDACKYKGRYRRGLACAELSPTDAAYIAGLIDGEGSIMLVTRNHGVSCHLRVTVSSTHEGVLRWLAVVTNVGKVYRLNLGTARHKPSLAWRAHGDGALTLLTQIAPYIKIKPEQVALGIETHQRLQQAAFKADTSWQEEYAIRMKHLNARGPQTTYSLTVTAGT